jgi:6-phosphogluconolactonase
MVGDAMTVRLFFVGSYAPADKPGVYAFSLDDETGAVQFRASQRGIANPSFVVVHPNRKWVYAVSELGIRSHGKPGKVCALAYDANAHHFRALNQQLSDGDLPCHLTIDATGKWILVANYGSGSMSVLPILQDGSLGAISDHVQHQGSGPNKQRQKAAHAHSTTLTPDNRFAIVADLGMDELVMYAFDAVNGKVKLHARVATPPGAGPRHLAFHPNGNILYCANELSNTVGVYEYDAANGALHEKQMLDTLPPNPPPNTVADIHVSADGARVYVSNRGHDSIAVFSANARGMLERVAIVSCGGKTPRNFALAPNGKFILVANQDTGEVCVLRGREGTNEIGGVSTRVAVPGACCIQFV